MKLPAELESLKRFHGHLGPYVTVGLRMGLVAKRVLGDYHGLKATVYCDLEPPMRCVLDGIQFSSCCTFGKGNISAREGPNPKAVFIKEGKKLVVSLKPGLRERIDSEMSKAREVEQSLRYYRIPEDDLLEVSLG